MSSTYDYIDFNEMYDKLDFGSTESLKIETFEDKIYFRNLINNMYYGDSLKGQDSGEYKYITITNLSSRGFVKYFNKDKFVNAKKTNKAIIRPNDVGDILVSRSRKPGVFSKISKKEVGKAFGSFIIKIELKEEFKKLTDYLVLYLNSSIVQKYLEVKKSGGVGGNINQTIIRKIPIIKANYLKERNKKLDYIIDEINKLYQKIEYIKKEKKENTKQKVIDRVFSEFLDVDEKKISDDFSSGYLGVDFNDINNNFLDRMDYKGVKNEYKRKKGWKLLKENAKINHTNKNPKNKPEEEFCYIDISSIDEKTKIINPDFIMGKEAPSRAKRVVHKGDVIVSTVRPYLQNIAIITNKLDNSVCSTGFAVIKPDKELLLPDYLFYYFYTSDFYNYVILKMTGTSYPSITASDLELKHIPIPTIQIQKNILKNINEGFNQIDNYDRKIKSVKEKINNLVNNYIINGYNNKTLNAQEVI